MDTSKWKSFKLEELFEIVPTKKLTYKKIDLPSTPNDTFNLPAVTCTTYNNGISCFVPRNEASILRNMLSVAANGDAPAFYHSGEFTILQDAYALQFKNKELNSNEYLFLLVLLQKILLKFDWTNKSGWQKVKQESILLPIDKQDKPDWEFMQETIKQTQKQVLATLKLYEKLQTMKSNGGRVSSFSPFICSSDLPKYQSFINEAIMQIAKSLLNSLPCKWREFKLTDLFSYKRGTRLKQSDRKKGVYPLVTAGEYNKGIKEYISNENQELFSNAITIDMFCNAFVHIDEFCCDDNILVLNAKKCMSNEILLFICTIINQDKMKWGYEKQYRQNSLEEHNIFLPTDSNEKPHFTLMQSFIKELKEEHTAKLITYYNFLQASSRGGGIKFNLSEYENFIQSFTDVNSTPFYQKNQFCWKEFKLGELFKLELSKGDLQPKKLEEGNIPLVSAGNFKNGIVMNIKNGDGKAEKFSKNVITIDMFGKAFYQNTDFYAVSHGRVNICVPKFALNFHIGLFLVSVIDANLNTKFGFNKMCSQSRLEQERILLPIDSKGQPHFTLMESFIKELKEEYTEKLIAYYTSGGGLRI